MTLIMTSAWFTIAVFHLIRFFFHVQHDNLDAKKNYLVD